MAHNNFYLYWSCSYSDACYDLKKHFLIIIFCLLEEVLGKIKFKAVYLINEVMMQFNTLFMISVWSLWVTLY